MVEAPAASADPVIDVVVVEMKTFAPFRERPSFAVIGHEDGTSRVPGLFREAGPTTVSRFIASIVVDAINGVLRRWARSHVCEEVLERRQPPGAHLNAASAISLVARVVAVTAAFLHCLPDSIFAGPGRAVGLQALPAKVGLVAAATNRVPASQAAGDSNVGRAAIAMAYPTRLLGVGVNRVTVKHNKATESSAREVGSRHGDSFGTKDRITSISGYQGQFFLTLAEVSYSDT